MTAIGAKVLTVDNLGAHYHVIVRIGFPKYRGSFHTLTFGDWKPFTGFTHNAQLDLVYHDDPHPKSRASVSALDDSVVGRNSVYTSRGSLFISLRALNKFMRTILLGLCALALFAGLTPKTAAQAVTTTLGAPTVDLNWVWSDEYQCWVWNGPQFQGDYEGHSFFKEHFLNHQFFNFFENTPPILWFSMPNIQLNAIAGESPLPSP
jgi:hypothetical protein